MEKEDIAAADGALGQARVDAVATAGWTVPKAALLLPRFDLLAARQLEEKDILENKAKYLLAITGAAISLCISRATGGGIAPQEQLYLGVLLGLLAIAGMMLVGKCLLPVPYDSTGDEPKDVLQPEITGQPEEYIMLGLAARLQQRIADNRARNTARAAWLRRLAIALPITPLAAYALLAAWNLLALGPH